MILHIIPETQYCNSFMDFISSYYDKDEHYFCITRTKSGAINYSVFNLPYEIWDSGLYGKINKLASKAEKIVFHGLFHWQFMLWIAVHFKKNIYISIWGGELYDHQKILDRECSLREKAIDVIKGIAFRQANMFINDMAEDYRYLKEWYHIKKPSIHAIYPQPLKKSMLDSIKEKRDNKDGIVRIVIGNSATDTNQHIAVFELLKKYKDENILVYCPLSYGDADYRDKVIEAGKGIFQDKFISVLNYMNPEEYVTFLSQMDIGIFNNNRQQAMANIALLGYMGAKLFIRNDTTMWEQYVETSGCNMTNVDDIDSLLFDEFIYFDEEYQNTNFTYFEKLWDDKYIKEMWDKVLLSDGK